MGSCFDGMEPFGAKGELSEVSEKFGGLDWLDLKPCGLKASDSIRLSLVPVELTP